MKVLITGGGGQLAREFCKFLKGHDVWAPTHRELDITDQKRVREAFEKFKPNCVINTAAYHKVDECEAQIGRALLVNAYGGYVAAQAARDVGARSVYISTGFVFGGEKNVPYEESDAPDPVNIYGHSKALAERLILACDPTALVVRTNGLYGRFSGKNTKGGAGNFVDMVWAKARAGENLDMVADQKITPTLTADFVPACFALALDNADGGIYHLAGSGETSWFEVAKKIYEMADAHGAVRPITSKERNAPARRPANAALANTKRPALPRWEDAIARYLAEKN